MNGVFLSRTRWTNFGIWVAFRMKKSIVSLVTFFPTESTCWFSSIYGDASLGVVCQIKPVERATSNFKEGKFY